jgi:hypothetical protein
MTSFPRDSTDAREQREAEQARLEQAAAHRREHDERCRSGWLGDDAEGRPIPCPVHRPHLLHVACWTCSSPYEACATGRAALRGACCPACQHSRRTRRILQTDPPAAL